MLRSVTLIWFVCCLSYGCEGDSSEANNPANQARAAGMAAQHTGGHMGSGDRPMGDEPGCYDIMIHKCDCSLSEQACTDAMQIWTERCMCVGAERTADSSGGAGGEVAQQMTASGGAASSGGEVAMARPFACYNEMTKECKCSTTQAQCAEENGIWTDRCICDPEGTGSGPAEATYGCYSGPPNHMCDCNTTEAQCQESMGAWTDSCDCPAAGAGGAPAMGGPPPSGGAMAGGSNGPSGCYDLGTHMCDCNSNEAACTEAGKIWSDRCGCGDDAPPANSGDGSGCYDLGTHMCDCDSTEQACAEAGRIWSDRCGC